ncbi:ubiquitin [Pseudomonas lundensis]|uniref:ubiquitin-like protein n=1 Tax=Pseudomonas lundensis TaxID=86185 RepID=UPI001473F59A|nr:ubiquitin-like protein [Pseudomonas lundensis]NNA34118.1 ubiquitin [Pseudomonas lundensis]
MNIFIRTITGKTFPLEILPTDTIENIKNKIQLHEGVPVSDQRIHLVTTELQDGKVLSDYDIGNNATLDMKLKISSRS